MAYLLLAAGVVTTGLRAPCSPHLLLFRCRPMLTSYSTAAGPCSGHLLLYRCRVVPYLLHVQHMFQVYRCRAVELELEAQRRYICPESNRPRRIQRGRAVSGGQAVVSSQ